MTFDDFFKMEFTLGEVIQSLLCRILIIVNNFKKIVFNKNNNTNKINFNAEVALIQSEKETFDTFGVGQKALQVETKT